MMEQSCDIRIYSDSRGRGVDDRLYSQLEPLLDRINITFDPEGGAKLERIRHLIRQNYNQPDLTIVVAGICNFTERKGRGKHATISYSLDTQARDNKKATAKRTIVDLLTNYGKCIVSTIAPAKLTASDNPSQDKLRQEALLSDLEEVNLFIKSESASRGLQLINLAKTCYLSSRKRRGKSRKTVWQFTDKELPDGVHLSEKLQDRWAGILATGIRCHLGKEEVIVSDGEGD